MLSSWGGKNSPLLLLLPPPLLLQNRLFPAWLGTERVTGQGVYWNTVFSSAASAVQLQYSRNIVLLCGRSPRPAPFFVLNTSPSHQSVTILLRVSLPVSPSRPLAFSLLLWHVRPVRKELKRGGTLEKKEKEEPRGGKSSVPR